MESFVIRAYGFNELARLYFPDIAPKSASNRLRVWLRNHEDFYSQLAKTGYSPRQKVFSPRQVQLVIDEFGIPNRLAD